MKTIIRYQNRKLYSQTDHQYINLFNVKQYIQNGETIKVINYKTMQDETKKTLLEVLNRKQKRHTKMSVENLHEVIANKE